MRMMRAFDLHTGNIQCEYWYLPKRVSGRKSRNPPFQVTNYVLEKKAPGGDWVKVSDEFQLLTFTSTLVYSEDIKLASTVL